MIKESIHEEDITILNVRTRQQNCKICETKLRLKKEIDKFTIITVNSNILLLKFNELRLRKNIEQFNNTINLWYVSDIYRALHPKRAEYAFFSSTHWTHTKIYHLQDHKTTFNNLKNLDVIEYVLWPQ